MTGLQVSFSVSPRPPRSTSPSYRGLFAAPSSFRRSRKLRKFRGLTASLTYTETGSNGLRAWHAVRVLPSPPRSPMRTDVSRSLRNSPQFAGVSAGSNADVRSLPLAEVAIASILAAGLWGSANPFLARDGVAHEDRQVQIDKPSIAYWRDHAAGASRRRVTPMPRGSRPSTAAFTRSGA